MGRPKAQPTSEATEQADEATAVQEHFYPESGIVVTAPSKDEADKQHEKQLNKAKEDQA